MRWPAVSKYDDEEEGVSWDAQQIGLGFQRPISLWRTGKFIDKFRHMQIDVCILKLCRQSTVDIHTRACMYLPYKIVPLLQFPVSFIATTFIFNTILLTPSLFFPLQPILQ